MGTIWIRFTDFDCEPEYDTVTITDKDGTRLGFFDGENDSDDNWQTKEMVSNMDTVEVHFETDGSTSRNGWKLNWGMVGESIPKSGILTSPNYPSLYPSSHDSTQTIEVAEGKTIHLSWTRFDTEYSYDYVQIVDKDGIPFRMQGHGPRIWGTSLPPPFTSNSNIVRIKFHTDGDTRRTGWRLEWTEQ